VKYELNAACLWKSSLVREHSIPFIGKASSIHWHNHTLMTWERKRWAGNRESEREEEKCLPIEAFSNERNSCSGASFPTHPPHPFLVLYDDFIKSLPSRGQGVKREGSSHHDCDPNNLVTTQLQASIGRPTGANVLPLMNCKPTHMPRGAPPFTIASCPHLFQRTRLNRVGVRGKG
jgi:hypothetical protein